MSQQQRQERSESEAADVDVFTQVVRRVAELEGVDPTALEPRLFEAIDPEALTTLVEGASANSPVALEFTYTGYQVTLNAGADVTVEVATA